MVERYRRATLPEATLIKLTNAWVVCPCCGEAAWWYWEPQAVQAGIAPYLVCLQCNSVVAQEPGLRIVASSLPFPVPFGAGRHVRLGRLP